MNQPGRMLSRNETHERQPEREQPLADRRRFGMLE